jgi:uncharacterized RDD family membrane protein YckC
LTFLWVFGWALTASAAPPAPRDVLGHADGSRFWIAQVERAKDQDEVGEQTTIWYRGRFDSWAPMPPVGGRVVSMASGGGELLLVMADGQWMIADGDELRPGPAAPGGEKMLSVANDRDDVWAIVLSDESTTQATTAASNSATRPAGQRLVAFRFEAGKWVDPQNLPPGVSEEPIDLSMTVVDHLPWICWRGRDGSLRIVRLGENHSWLKAPTPAGPGPADFKLLTIQGQAALWRDTAQNSAGIAGILSLGNDFSKTITLSAPASVAATTSGAHVVSNSHTVAFAFERVRWLGIVDDQPIDQAYDLEGHTAGAMEVVRGPQSEPIPLGPCVATAAAAVLIAAGSAMRQRKSQPAVLTAKGPRTSPGEIKLRLAPLGVRFSAGLVDLLPCLAAVGLLHHPGAEGLVPLVDPESVKRIAALAVLTYLMHTTVAEAICGQSIGKMFFGIRVVGPEGEAPSLRSIILRNILRVLDLAIIPLVLVFLTPLRQRIGDLAAGTVVIAPDVEEDRPEA